MKIGVMVESFRKGFKGGVDMAAAIGAQGIQAYATGGELGVDTATDASLKEALDYVHSKGLVFSAICGDFGVGFMDPEKNKIYVEKSMRVLDLAKKLECNVVTTHIGTVPDHECERKEIMRKACRTLAEYADSIGSAFAVETGPEKGQVLAEFLDSLGAGGVRVNFDPANLVMVAGDRPENALKYLGKYVVHTHAKDGIKLKGAYEGDLAVSPQAKDHQDMINMGRTYLELPLGKGDVDFDIYLPALRASGFNGFLTIEREVGNQPEKDIALAVEFLREKIKKFNLA